MPRRYLNCEMIKREVEFGNYIHETWHKLFGDDEVDLLEADTNVLAKYEYWGWILNEFFRDETGHDWTDWLFRGYGTFSDKIERLQEMKKDSDTEYCLYRTVKMCLKGDANCSPEYVGKIAIDMVSKSERRKARLDKLIQSLVDARSVRTITDIKKYLSTSRYGK